MHRRFHCSGMLKVSLAGRQAPGTWGLAARQVAPRPPNRAGNVLTIRAQQGKRSDVDLKEGGTADLGELPSNLRDLVVDSIEPRVPVMCSEIAEEIFIVCQR